MTHPLVETVARVIADGEGTDFRQFKKMFRNEAERILQAILSTHAIVPREEVDSQLNAARDWAIRKYGKGIGNDAASGCYRAMLFSAPKVLP